MTTRADVTRLSIAQRAIVQAAQSDLAKVFSVLDLSDPGAARDALLDVVPFMVAEYGDLAAVAAAEWYEQIHPGSYQARLGGGVPTAQVEGSVRYHAGRLFGDDPAAILSGIGGSMQRFISYSSRATVARNAEHDPSRPRYARVPTGAKTCAWCSMLASRGFVYHTEKSAGINPKDFHDDCDCQITPEWDRDTSHIEGYDPDHLYDMYRQARAAAGSSDQKAIAERLRAMFPDQITDGHVHQP